MLIKFKNSMKKVPLTLILLFIVGCQSPKGDQKKVLLNEHSDEITFILELTTAGNTRDEVESFTQYMSDFIVKREPSSVYGYYISKDNKKVTLIERYNNSDDGIQHGIDFINGPNFDKFFEVFEIEKFITIGNASEEFKTFASDNGFEIEYRESIGGFVRK